MKSKDIYDDISSIKNIMERSTKFISLSGLSGVLAGVYALIGAAIAYYLIPIYILSGDDLQYLVFKLSAIAASVLILAVATGIWLTIRKAHRKNQTIWNESSRSLLKNGLVPLLTGGGFALILIIKQYYGLMVPACLIFYGLSLMAASNYTFGDVKWLGVSEVILGLLCMLFPLNGLLFWAFGFGLLHILYGTVMYFKYDRENRAA